MRVRILYFSFIQKDKNRVLIYLLSKSEFYGYLSHRNINEGMEIYSTPLSSGISPNFTLIGDDPNLG